MIAIESLKYLLEMLLCKFSGRWQNSIFKMKIKEMLEELTRVEIEVVAQVKLKIFPIRKRVIS